jgi:hypothetical protein
MIVNQDCLAKRVLSRGWYQWDGGGDIRKGCKRMNMVEIFCTMCINGKMRPVETIPGMGEGDKGE